MLFTDSTTDVSNALESCSKYMIGYLLDFVTTFRNYCTWHSQFCVLQFILCLIQAFKMPSLSRKKELAKLKAEKDRVTKLHKDAFDHNDKKLDELEKKRQREDEANKVLLQQEE